MKPFFRAVIMSLRYKWSIIGAVLCAVMISLLWSASISTILPVAQVVLQGETFHDWIDHEIAKSEQSITELTEQIEVATQTIDDPSTDDDQRHVQQLKIDIANDRLHCERELLFQYSNSLQPIIQSWAPDTPFTTLAAAMAGLLIVTLLKGIFLVASSYFTARVASMTVMDMRRIYYRKALELDQQRIDRLGTSNMMTHLSHNMMMVTGGLRAFYGKCLREPLKMVACLSVAAWISLPLLLISLIVLPAGFFVVRGISRRMKRSTQSEMEGVADVFQTLIETFQKVKTVRIFNRERTERRRFRNNAKLLYRMNVRISIYDSLLRPISELLGIISIALAILSGAWLVLNRETHLFGVRMLDTPMSPMTLLMFYASIAAASDPARKMTEVINVIVRGNTACQNLSRVFDVYNRVKTPTAPVPVPVHSKSIVFEKVVFCYKPKQPVIRNISIEIPYCQTIAIVGGNGSGKSTLMNLLCRFYDPNRGRILIDGTDIRQTSPRKHRGQIAWVTQDSVLFQGTIRDNILYANPNATDAELESACNTARLHDFVETMPMGIDTIIGDNGSHLSAGQRQRIAIARAVLANPRILILDEATSQVDSQAESLIHKELTGFMKGRTTIIVTHKKSSLLLADRVVVMRSGQIVSQGSVEQAVKDNDPMRSLLARSA